MEVAKTRLQLDGELGGKIPASLTSSSTTSSIPSASTIDSITTKIKPTGKVYTSAIDCMRKTWKFEGIGGVQRGLGAAVRSAPKILSNKKIGRY